MDDIFEYFNGYIEYPKCDNEILPFGELWIYTNDSLLDAFVNDIKLFGFYVFSDNDISDSCEQIEILNWLKPDMKYEKIKGKKSDIFYRILKGEINFYHIKFSDLQENCVLIGKIRDEKDKYIFMEYSLSGRCVIGRFITQDKEKDILDSIEIWLKNESKYFYKFPVDCIGGWMKW